MLLFLLRKGQLRFPVLMTLLLFMGMLPNQGVAENNTGRNWWSGTPLPKIKCYECAGEANSDCAHGKNQGDKVDCDGVCSIKTGGIKEGYVTKSCSFSRDNYKRSYDYYNRIYRISNVEGLKCFKEVYGGLCYESNGGDRISESNKNSKVSQCENAAINSQNSFERYGDDDDRKPPVKANTCYCESNLCNTIVYSKADHSSPDKKLIFAISMMATLYLSVSWLN